MYLVATPDVAALRDLSRHVENFGLDVTAAYKVRIVLNRSSSHDAVSKEQVESAVRFPVSVSIPNNYAELIRAINAGSADPAAATIGIHRADQQMGQEAGACQPGSGRSQTKEFRILEMTLKLSNPLEGATMADAVVPMTTPDRSALPTPLPQSVSLKAQQEIKSAVHQKLIKRMDWKSWR